MHKRSLVALTLLTIVLAGALLPAAAQCQPPAYRYRWGSLGSGDGQFNYPNGVAADGSGNIYVADMENQRIQVFGSLPVPTKSTSWGRIKALYR